MQDLMAIACTDTKAGLLTAEDTTRCTHEPTRLNLNGSTGSITWITRPYGDIAWSAISGEYDSVITVLPEVDREYAALVTGSCTDTSNSIVIRVSTFPDTPDPGFGGESCENYFSLSAYPAPYPKTGFWSVFSGPGNAEFHPSSEQPDPDSVTVDLFGLYTFSWNITDGICTKDSTIEINVLEQPRANAGSNANQCGRAFNLNARLSIPGSTGEWYKVSGSSTFNFIDPSDPNTLVNANPGTYYIRWTERYSTCEDDTTIQINVADQPTAHAGFDKDACEPGVNLYAIPSIGLGNWSQIAGPGVITFDNTNLANTFASADLYGENYVLQWKETNSFCADSDTVTINFYEKPVAHTTEISDACGIHTELVANTSTQSGLTTRSWKYISGPQAPLEVTPVNDTTAFVNIVPGKYGDYTFRWLEKNGTCSDSIDIDFTFYEQPIADAGENTLTCGDSIQLNATPDLGNSQYLWKGLNDTAGLKISDHNDPQATISSEYYKTYQIVWKESNYICSDSDTITVEFVQVPVANPGLAGNTCGYRYNLEAVPSLSTSTGWWSYVTREDTTTISTHAETLAHVDTSGTFEFQWTEDNKGCTDKKSIRITFYEQPDAAILEANDACGLKQTIATAPINNNQGLLTTDKDSLADIRPIEQDIYQIQVSDTGIYRFTWQAGNDRCSDDTSFSIHFSQIPEITVGKDSQACGKDYTLDASMDIGSGTWSLISGPGNCKFTNISDPRTTIETDEYGDYSLRWTVKNGACTIFDDLKLEMTAPPASYAGNDDNICGLTYALSATPSPGSWSVIAKKENVSVSFQPDSLATNAKISVDQAGPVKLAWIATQGACTDTSALTINFFDQPSANAGPDQELDNVFNTTMQATAPAGTNLGEWQLLSGTGTIASVNSPDSKIDNMELGTNTFIWKVKNDYCESSDTISVIIYDIFIPQVITPNGDNENDYFVIRGVENVGPVEVLIFNRWGIEVYSTDNYQNDWGGTNKNGNLLTNDTYFYVINVANSRIFKGFVVIKK
jgi:trimeric autotransporter adhesin